MNVLKSFLDACFPRFCIQCHKKISQPNPGYICPECFQTFVWHQGGCCRYCGKPMMDAGENLICTNCLELQPVFDRGVTLFKFQNVGKQFIHTLKYRNGFFLKEDLKRIFEHQAERLALFHKATFVPVPLYFTRQMKRGFNQSLWIAKLLAQYCQGNVSTALKRVRATPSQTGLNKEERQKNVRNAFILKKALNPQLDYVIVDDVFTTGATLNACAKALGKVKSIRICTLAHG